MNPDTVLVFRRREWCEDLGNEPAGIVCQLPLTQDGLAALFDGRLNTRDPDEAFIAAQNERPAAIYFWGIYTPPEVAGGIALVMERLTSDKYRGLPVYCKAANSRACAFFQSLGFVMGARHGNYNAPDIMTCPRKVDQDQVSTTQVRPPYDTYLEGAAEDSKRIGITVVHDIRQLLQVHSIRAATYLAEQEMPFAEDVDGNDLTATHLLGYMGNEPAGCLRIRYFAGFVKLERLAVLARYRKSRMALKLVKAGIELCRAKGYTRFYGQTATNVAPIWQHFGFVLRNGPGIRYLTDEVYFEADLELPAADSPLSPWSGASVLVRPEGQWDRPGVLEQEGMAQ
jgi:predicted GNAT family N-acyltransferase